MDSRLPSGNLVGRPVELAGSVATNDVLVWVLREHHEEWLERQAEFAMRQRMGKLDEEKCGMNS